MDIQQARHNYRTTKKLLSQEGSSYSTEFIFKRGADKGHFEASFTGFVIASSDTEEAWALSRGQLNESKGEETVCQHLGLEGNDGPEAIYEDLPRSKEDCVKMLDAMLEALEAKNQSTPPGADIEKLSAAEVLSAARDAFIPELYQPKDLTPDGVPM